MCRSKVAYELHGRSHAFDRMSFCVIYILVFAVVTEVPYLRLEIC